MYDVPMRLGWSIQLVMVVSALLTGSAQAPDAESTLQRTRERLLADLDRLPRYTCVQTIVRRYYRPQSEAGSCSGLMAAHEKRKGESGLRGWDRLRLEVAIVDGDNVYSWVGAPRFESGTLEKLAGRGPLSSGDFGPFLHSIFTRATVTFKGEEPDGSHRLLAYSYDVPAERSRYMVKTDSGWAATAYRGEFVLDAAANDIVSLTVRTAELPESNPDCQAISAVDYGRTQIHDRPVLVPRATRLVTIDRQGSETHSVTEYASCREYASKTRMLFDTPSAGDAASSPTSSPPPSSSLSEPASATPFFPAGLRFHGRIVSLIDSGTAAAGDAIEVVLRSPIRDKNNLELAPAGARLHGRLLGVEERTTPLDVLRLLIQFESIDLHGRTVPLRATPESSVMVGISVFRAPVSVAPEDDSPDVTALVFRKPHVRLQKFDWDWTTLAASGEEPAGNAH